MPTQSHPDNAMIDASRASAPAHGAQAMFFRVRQHDDNPSIASVHKYQAATALSKEAREAMPLPADSVFLGLLKLVNERYYPCMVGPNQVELKPTHSYESPSRAIAHLVNGYPDDTARAYDPHYVSPRARHLVRPSTIAAVA